MFVFSVKSIKELKLKKEQKNEKKNDYKQMPSERPSNCELNLNPVYTYNYKIRTPSPDDYRVTIPYHPCYFHDSFYSRCHR